MTRQVTRRGMISGSIGLWATAASGDTVGAVGPPVQKTSALVHGTLVGGPVSVGGVGPSGNKGQRVFTDPDRARRAFGSSNKDINLDTHITDIANLIKWEDLNEICLVAHSYGGWVGSGALEQIGDRVSSIVWLDAFKPEDGQKPIVFTNEAFRKAFLNSVEKGEQGFPIPPPKLPPIFVNEKDRDYVDAKLTPQPVGTYAQAIRLSGARERWRKRRTSERPSFPIPLSIRRWRSARLTARGTLSKQMPTTS